MNLCEFSIPLTGPWLALFLLLLRVSQVKILQAGSFLQDTGIFFSLGPAIVLGEQFWSGLIESHIPSNSWAFWQLFYFLNPPCCQFC